MKRRQLGTSELTLSQVTYGAMRVRNDDGLDPVAVLCELHDAGIDTHHSSHEYDCHGLYLESLTAARATGRNFEHIVKLSSPSFDSSVFSGDALRALVDHELTTLGAQRLASVQWLVRTPDASDESGRIAVLADQAEEIGECLNDLTASGKVADISVFPYSPAFAAAAIAHTPSRTLCTYLNLNETEYVPLLDDLDAFLAIRPLAGGVITTNRATALEFPLLHPKVTTMIVSANSGAHIAELLEATAEVEADLTRFDDTLAAHVPDPQ